MATRIVQPGGWKRPRGYSHGMAASGTLVFIAGQIGWDEKEHLVSDDFAAQTEQALRNVVTVLEHAGGAPRDLVRLTWYVTSTQEYTASGAAVGRAYRRVIGDVYPAMTLVEVSALLEKGAKVEIEATAVLPA